MHGGSSCYDEKSLFYPGRGFIMMIYIITLSLFFVIIIFKKKNKNKNKFYFSKLKY